MTSLACLFRDEKRYNESEQAFGKALAIRQKLFGSHSEKVGETLLGYSQLLQVEGKTEEGKLMQAQAESIGHDLAKAHESDSMAPLIVSCIFIALCFQKDKLLILLARHVKKGAA